MLEVWQACMFFRCFTGCKDIDAIIRADTNENGEKMTGQRL